MLIEKSLCIITYDPCAASLFVRLHLAPLPFLWRSKFPVWGFPPSSTKLSVSYGAGPIAKVPLSPPAGLLLLCEATKCVDHLDANVHFQLCRAKCIPRFCSLELPLIPLVLPSGHGVPLGTISLSVAERVILYAKCGRPQIWVAFVGSRWFQPSHQLPEISPRSDYIRQSQSRRRESPFVLSIIFSNGINVDRAQIPPST